MAFVILLKPSWVSCN